MSWMWHLMIALQLQVYPVKGVIGLLLLLIYGRRLPHRYCGMERVHCLLSVREDQKHRGG